MKNLICILLATMVSVSAFAWESDIVRSPKSHDEFKAIIRAKLDSSLIKKRKLRLKLSEKDLHDILSYVPLNDDGKFSISYVRQVPETTKDTLYDTVYQALVDVYVNAKNVIQMRDSENGIIICKGIVDYTLPELATYKSLMGISTNIEEIIGYTIKIQVREGRYKVDIYDMRANEGLFSDSEYTMSDFLGVEFYNTSYTAGILKEKRSDKGYQTTRLVYILYELNQLYDLEESIYNKVSDTDSDNDDW